MNNKLVWCNVKGCCTAYNENDYELQNNHIKEHLIKGQRP